MMILSMPVITACLIFVCGTEQLIRNEEGTMGAILWKAAAFAAIIILGYIMRRIGFFKKEDFYLFSRIVIKITLPAAIISNFSKMTLNMSLLFMCFIGLLGNVMMVGVGYLINIKKDKSQRAFDMINMSGYNIGNFALPFIQSFLGPVGFAVTSLFDAGNAVMCTGVTFTLATIVAGNGKRPSLKTSLLSLISSFPFDAYVIMTILAILKIKLPEVILSFAQTVGGANAFLAMLMIGIGFEIKLSKEKLSTIVRVLSARYGLAVLASLGAYFLLPFSLEVRQALSILALSPVSSVGPAFTGRIHGDVGLASVINSLSIAVSIVAMTVALLIVI